MGRRAGALFVTAAILAVPSALAQVALAPTIFRGVNLPANAVKGLTVACPRGYVAVSGGLSTAAPGVALLRVEPAGTGAFAFRVGNPAGKPTRRVAVAVACRRLRTRSGPGASFTLKPLQPRSLVVAAGAQRSAALACPSGTAPAGAGLDLAPGRRGQTTGFTGTQLSVRRIIAGLRSFSFTVRNSGTTARRVALSGNCITVVSKAGAPREQLRVKVTTFRGSVDPGRQRITRSCPRGWFSLAAGYAVPDRSVVIEGAAALAGGGTWSVVSDAGGPARMILQLVCGRLER